MLKVWLAQDDNIIVRLLPYSPVLIIIWSVLLATVAAVYFAKRSRTSPPPWPVVAGARPFIGNSMENLDSLGAQLDIWAKMYDNEKGIFELQLFGTRFIVPCRVETMELIMNERPFRIQRNSKLNDAIASVGADGLFSAEGETWKSDRRLVAPALNRKNVEDYLSMINMVTDRLVEKWESETAQGDRHVVVNQDVLSMTMDIISLVAFGKDMDFLRAQGSVGPDLLKLMNVAMIRAFSVFPYWKIPWIGQYLDGAVWPKHRLLHYFSSLVKQHESLAEETSGASSKDNHKSRTFLSKVIALCRHGNTASMSHDRLVGNLFTLFAAGSETTHVTICSCLWEIATDTTGLQDELAYKAQRMKNMEKANVEELLNVFPRIRSLMYEILRLKGPVSFLGFQFKDEFSICGTKLPPSTKIFFPAHYISMQPGQTPSGPLNASVSDFCARRYLVVDRGGECESANDNNNNLSVVRPSYKTGFNSFGNGRRVCPGRDLAEMEVIICLASVLRKFVVTLKEGHPPMKLVTRFTESPNMDIMLSLQPRGSMHTS